MKPIDGDKAVEAVAKLLFEYSDCDKVTLARAVATIEKMPSINPKTLNEDDSNDYQYPIKKYIGADGSVRYSYKCAKCEAPVIGYKHKRIKGQVLCKDCQKIRDTKYVREWRKKKGDAF